MAKQLFGSPNPYLWTNLAHILMHILDRVCVRYITVHSKQRCNGIKINVAYGIVGLFAIATRTFSSTYMKLKTIGEYDYCLRSTTSKSITVNMT